MQAIPHMILSDGILSTLDGAQLIPVDGRFVSKPQAVSIVELGKKLLKAAREGDAVQVRELMSKGAPFTTDWLGTSPLHFAALNNHLETCEILLRAGISRDSRTKVDRTPLHMAAYEGHIGVVEMLLNNGADVDARDMLKMTPLHWAAQNGHIDVVEILLRHGANSDLVNKFDKSPGNIAIEINRLDILQSIQMIIRDPIEIAENVAVEFSNLDVDPTAAKPRILSDKHFLDPEEAEDTENQLAERLDTVQQEVVSANIDLTDSLQMLKDHGISYLPADNSTVVASAVENGHSLVLTEVGKQVLNSTKPNNHNIIRTIQKPEQKIQRRKVFTLTSEQLLAMTNAQNNKLPIIVNGFDKAKRFVVKKKLLSPAPANITHNFTKRVKIENNRMVITNSNNNKTVNSTQPDIELITRQLAEARREAEEYKLMLKRKEAEAERYKRQLQSITQTK